MAQADRATQQTPTPARSRARLGAALFFASFVLGQIGPIIAQPFGAGSLLISVPLMIGLYGLVAYFIAQGRNWARVVGTVVVCLGILVLLFVRSDQALFFWLGVAQATLWAGFLLLVFSAPGASWFRQ